MGEEEFVKNYDENHGREWNANKKRMIPKAEFDEVDFVLLWVDFE